MAKAVELDVPQADHRSETPSPMRCVLAVVARLVAAVLAATTFANAKFVHKDFCVSKDVGYLSSKNV